MSYTFIQNQPILFSKDTLSVWRPGRGEYDWASLFNRTDFPAVQMKVAAFENEFEFIVDPDISNGPTNWGGDGTAAATTNLVTIGNGGAGYVEPDLYGSDFGVSRPYWQLQINVTVMFGTAYIRDSLGGDILGTIQSTGFQTFCFPTTTSYVNIGIDDDTSYIEFTSASFKPLPEVFMIGATDTEGDPVALLISNQSPDNFILQKDRLTINMDFQGLSPFATLLDGCYYWCIADPEENTCSQFGLYNHDFNIDNYDESGKSAILGWTNMEPGGDALFYPGPFRAELLAHSMVSDPEGIVNTLSNLCADKEYLITIHAEAGAGVDLPTLSIRVGTATNGFIGVDADDNYQLLITPDANAPLEIWNGNAGSDSTLIIYDVSVTLVNLEDYDLPYCTEYPFKIADTWEDTLLITVHNHEDGLGFVFLDGVFVPMVRIEGNIINRKFEIEKEKEDDDKGIRRIQFGEMRKGQMLRTELLPNFMHDFFAMACIADQFYVNQEVDEFSAIFRRFIINDDSYEPQYGDELDNFAFAEFEIQVSEQLVRNTNSGLENFVG